jgi:asparagine synthase (glutamine-hydrolysing)
MFESHFPGPAAAATVPHGMSIACSTPTAIRWDEAFRQSADPSGRAVRGVHRDAY